MIHDRVSWLFNSLSLARPVSGEEGARKSPDLPPAAPKTFGSRAASKWVTGPPAQVPQRV